MEKQVSEEMQRALKKLEDVENALEKLTGSDWAMSTLVEEYAKIRVEIALMAAGLH